MSKLSEDPKSNLRLVKGLIDVVYDRWPILQQVCLAQAVHESRLLGVPSKLALLYNNLFGISGKDVTMDNKAGNDEHSYKVYPDLEQSVQGHARLMFFGTSDNKDRYKLVIAATTFEDAAYALVKAGYAEDKDYAVKLIQVHKTVEATLRNWGIV